MNPEDIDFRTDEDDEIEEQRLRALGVIKDEENDRDDD